MNADSRPILIFDGDCAFCTKAAQFYDAWLNRAARVRTEPWQFLDLAEYGLTAGDFADSLWFVDHERRLPAGCGVAAALKAADPVARPIGAILDAAPLRPMVDAAYRWVAANRYRLPGGTPACAMPAAQ